MKPKIFESITGSVTESVKRSLVVSFAGFVLGAGMAHNAFGGPTGATVVHGSAQFATPNANTLEITNSANAIINWQSFNIGQGETTRFIQPSADSAVLNRVTGVNPSELLGNLSSNGKVFLINPHGIVVGENAVIDVAGFVASTLNLNDEDFLNGRYRFQGENAGALINRGFITAGPGGEIALIAPHIENHGALSVDNGALLLAAGEKVTLTRFDLNGIEFEVQAPDNTVLNLGELVARRGAVGVFAGSIDHRGVIEAGSLGVDAAGNIVLQARDAITVDSGARIAANGADGGDIRIQSVEGDTVVRGDIEAVGRNGNGGSIQILGERVGLFGEAYVDVTGKTGGGEVLVGGDFQGKGEIQTARQTQLSADAKIHADATDSGDGGRVIVWADGFTEAHGLVTARGGDLSGNGGFVEISGKESLVFRGGVNTGAANGQAGTALFDPRDISIATGGGSPIASNDQFAENPSSDVVFDPAAIGALLGNQNVILQANRDILIAGGITSSSTTNDLTLMAGRSINAITGPFTVDTNGGDFTAIANATLADGVVTADRGAGAANISLISGNGFFINTNGGNILLEIRDGAGRTGTQATMGVITIGAGTGSDGIASGGGDITLKADNGVSIPFGGFVNAGTGSITIAPYSAGATIDVGALATGDMWINDSTLTGMTANDLIIGSSTSGNITFLGALTPQPANIANSLEFRSGGDIVFDQGSQLALGLTSHPNGTVTLNAGGAIIDNSPGAPDVFAGLTNGQLNAIARNGISVEADVSSLSYQNTDSGDVNIVSNFSGAMTLQASSNSGDGATTIEHGSRDIFVDGNISQGSSTNSLTLRAVNIINNAAITGAGGGILLESSTGDGITVTNNGTISDSGGVVINAAAGGTFVNGAAGVIDNAGGSGDIVINADDMDLQAGSTIDAGVANTVLNRVVGGDLMLGGVGSDLTGDELNTVLNNLVIGGASSQFANVNITGVIDFTANQNLTINAVSGITNDGSITGADGVRLASAGGGITITNNGTISNSGGVAIDTAAGGVFVNGAAGVIGNAGGSGDIVINADDIDLQAGSVIDAGAVAKTILNSVSGGDWAFGSDGVLSGDELNTILNNLVIGGADTTINNFLIGEAISFTNNQNLKIEVLGNIEFFAGIHDAGHVHLIADAVSDLADPDFIDVTANRLTLDTVSGVSLDTRVNQLTATNTGAGAISIINNTASLEILAPGVRNSGIDGGDISITNNAGHILVNGLVASDNASVSLMTTGGGDIIATTDIMAFDGVSLNSSRDLTIHAGPGPTTHARVSGGFLNLLVGRNLSLISDAAGNSAAIISDGGTGTQNGIGLQAGDVLQVGGTTSARLLRMSGGNATFNGDADLGSLAMSGGSAIFSDTADLGSLAMSAGSATFNGTTGLGELTINGGTLDGAGDVNVTGMTNWSGGSMDGTGTFTAGGGLNINGAVTLNRTLNNSGNGIWQGAGDIFGSGVFNNTTDGVFTIANDRTMATAFNNAGRVDKTGTGVTSFIAGYRQTAGATRLNGGTLELLEIGLSLEGGVLTGTGTVTTPTLDHSGGWIAPGSFIDPAAVADAGTPGPYGTLIIDGDLQMSGDAGIVLDVGVASELGGEPGVDFDLLDITGNAQLNGRLALIVNPQSFDAVIGNTFNPVIRYTAHSGEFSAGNAFPSGYAFSHALMAEGVGLRLTAVPQLGTDLIPHDELERLRDEFRENIARLKLERERRRKQDEEEEKRRRALMCS